MKKETIKIIYLYFFSLIGLVLLVVGSVRLMDVGLKVIVFRSADEPLLPPVNLNLDNQKDLAGEGVGGNYLEIENQRKQLEWERESRKRERERTLANSLALVLVGLPLFLYHWHLAKKQE